jgi:chromodomain-helicase-DNA-binding protein 1
VAATRRRIADPTASRAQPSRKAPQRAKYRQSSESSGSDDDEHRLELFLVSVCDQFREFYFFPRPATRRQGAAKSYKEDSGDETGSEDLVEVDWSQNAVSATEPDNSETIERVIETRFGRKGGKVLFGQYG